ncbi:MAG: diaminopimelate epimerase [Pirellulaceae bacterium]|jgi:diaminopimelate epimerase|nr:diaminopimelate epimerase [Planctomycetaceae bacterium]
MQFTKMHGAGNDYIYIDCIRQSPPEDPVELAIKMSHRRFGVGGDGLILICPSEIADCRMRMFNSDGSEAEMCGNGIRCVSKFVYDEGIAPRTELKIETGAGILTLLNEVRNGKVERVQVDMGEPILDAGQIPTLLPGDPTVVGVPLLVGGREFQVTCVSMGNPHAVLFVEEATDEMVLGIGPKIEVHKAFPQQTNVEFVEVLSRSELRQRTWERGSGETWACGTGATAVAVAAVLNGKTDRAVLIHLRGGDLDIRWDEADNHVYMTGPATRICDGTWDE